MLFDLIWNVIGPLAAKRYKRVRKALWVVLFFYLGCVIYRVWWLN